MNKWIVVITLLLGLFPNHSHSEDDNSSINDLFSLDLSELLNFKVKISSNKDKSIREQPSVVSVVTRDKILNSGAKNLLDILEQLPGFAAGVDAQGVFSLSLRGVWGIDGKILLIIDGIEQNDLAFGTIVLNNRYSAKSIQRVEVIRGPGSVIYGGAAELAVIKVTTVNSDSNLNQVFISTDISKDTLHNKNLTFNINGKLKNDWGYSIAGFLAGGDYASGDFTGILGNSFSLKGNSNVETKSINFNLESGNANFRFMYDDYRYEDRIGIGGIGLFTNDFFNPGNNFTEFTQNGYVEFRSLGVSYQQIFHPLENLEISSKLTLQHHQPWGSFYPERGPHKSDEEVSRWRADLHGLYSIDDQASLLMGVSYYNEKMTLKDSYFLDPQTFFNGRDSRKVDDYAVFFQYELDTELINLTLGGRLENHEFAGEELVPRFSLNKVGSDYHAKLVYNEAFKIPQFGTVATAEIVGNPIAGAEKSSTLELEYGKQVTPELYVQGNLYQIDIKDYIAYEPTLFANVTAGNVNTAGGELIIQAKYDSHDFEISYSYFSLESDALNGFSVEQKNQSVLGIPNQMLKAIWFSEINDNSLISVSTVINGPRYACVSDPITFSCGLPQKLDTETDVGVFYRKNIGQLS
ncbi:MAG: TonB-dependent receptor plug domain-containing protein, partial [Kangiellaceae bacterium]|nr:TonB-dependent receptor plug domain-containing protein [Kangiellaceae bacterium]